MAAFDRSSSRSSDPPTKPCWDRALGLLARRPHFRRELAQKLQRKGYDLDTVEETLGRLADRGFQDEDAAVRSFVRQRMARGPVGRLKVQADLARRGAEREAASRILDELMPEDDRDAAHDAAERWLERRRSHHKSSALARHLEGRGFSRRAIVAALEGHREALEDDRFGSRSGG